MSLTGKQKKYLKKNLKKKSLDEIASALEVSPFEIEEYLKKIWGKDKYQKFISQTAKKPTEIGLKEGVCSFDFKTWLKKNGKLLGFLTLLVFIAYANSLGNEFVSDDISGISSNQNLGNFNHVLSQPFSFIRPLLYFTVYRITGLNPFFYRIINVIFHMGTVWLVYALTSLIARPPLAILTAGIFAVHPLQSEAVTWISGGVHSQYSFFLLLSFLIYILFLFKKDRKFLLVSILSFILSLLSSEKAIVLPLLLLLFIVSFENLSKNWKSLTPFLAIGFLFGLIYLGGVGQRARILQTQFYQEPGIENPLFQIPIAITSYLELVFWPKNLTLYHSEMIFGQLEYFLRLGVFVLFLTTIAYFFKKDRRIFFWLSFFLVSLLPMLTPFRISWIVAERYVYLGSLGIFVLLATVIQKIGEFSKNQKVSYTFIAIILLGLSGRTIIRNVDWKNQDNLWLAAAKTSPSSPQNHNNLGDMYGRHGDYQKAIEEFKKATELRPGYADAHHNLANTYKQTGEVNEAIKNYQKAIEFNPNLWQSYQNLAGIYFEQEEFDQARESLETAIKINPQNAELYTSLGILYKKMGQSEEAKKALQTAITIDPRNLKAKQLLLQLQ